MMLVVLLARAQRCWGMCLSPPKLMYSHTPCTHQHCEEKSQPPTTCQSSYECLFTRILALAASTPPGCPAIDTCGIYMQTSIEDDSNKKKGSGHLMMMFNSSSRHPYDRTTQTRMSLEENAIAQGVLFYNSGEPDATVLRKKVWVWTDTR